ncbi:unnamed protein product, partial [Ectocarpus sp. 12 AP-2014]
FRDWTLHTSCFGGQTRWQRISSTCARVDEDGRPPRAAGLVAPPPQFFMTIVSPLQREERTSPELSSWKE